MRIPGHGDSIGKARTNLVEARALIFETAAPFGRARRGQRVGLHHARRDPGGVNGAACRATRLVQSGLPQALFKTAG
jgi:hypothetical protein